MGGMKRGRPLALSLGGVLVVTVAACLVFDGRQAMETHEAGAEDAASDSTLEDVQAVGDAGASDHGTSETEGGRDGGVLCNVGGVGGTMYCEGGQGPSCCAKSVKGGPWMYPNAACDLDCTSAPGSLTGYYQYRCDDDDDCVPPKLCCAHRIKATLPFSGSACASTCSSPPLGQELCQPGHPCRGTGACHDASLADLPPGYQDCQ
jgi:hypothetical protein